MRRSARVFLIGALSLVGCALPAAADPPPPVSAEDVLREREQSLEGIMQRHPAEIVAQVRQSCASGQEPKSVAKGRGFGSYSLPDAADECTTILYRMGGDGSLLVLYSNLMQSLTGSANGYELVPAAVAATAMKAGEKVVPLANGKGAVLTAALALDAGFTVAYPKHEKYAAGMPTAPALKPIAQRCLSQSEPDLSLCYATGYAYGVLASNRMQVTAVRTAVR